MILDVLNPTSRGVPIASQAPDGLRLPAEGFGNRRWWVQTTPIACVQDYRFHNELRLIAIVLLHWHNTSLASCWQVAIGGDEVLG